MIEILPAAWAQTVAHAESTYPHECCGVLLGTVNAAGVKVASVAVPLENAYTGAQHDRYEIRPEDLLAADRQARAQGLDLLAIFHSHPDDNAYFSQTDLENSCPWYSFVILSIKGGKFDYAASFLPNADQTAAPPEELRHPSCPES